MSSYIGIAETELDELPSGGQPGQSLIIGVGGQPEWADTDISPFLDAEPDEILYANSLGELESVAGLVMNDPINGIDRRIAGMTGTNAEKLLFSAVVPGTSYVRSDDCWAADIDTTPISVYCSMGGVNAHRRGIAISPLHVVMADHYTPLDGSVLDWVTKDNVRVTRTVVSSQLIIGTDLRIGKLDSPLPSTISFCRVLPADYTGFNLVGMPVLLMDQEYKILIKDISADNGVTYTLAAPSDPTRLAFHETLIAGDSSGPMAVVVGAELVLLGNVFSDTGGPSISGQLTAIDAAMTTLGGGYTTTQVVPKDTLWKHPVYEADIKTMFGGSVAIMNDVSSISALKALSVVGVANNTRVRVSGYYTLGDGGGGDFVYNSGSAAADNGGTVIAPTAGAGRWLRSNTRYNVAEFGAKGDGVADDTAEIQAALDAASAAAVANGKASVAAMPGKNYLISSAVVIPHTTNLDISACTITCSGVTAFTFGQNATLFGAGASIITSGASGTALKKTTASEANGIFIYGWPRLSATSARQAGSIGIDATGGYKGILEVNVASFETGVVLGGGAITTYYNELRSPRIAGCITAIKLNAGANSTYISNPQINGSSVGTHGVHADGVAGLTIMGGWMEQFIDGATTRAVLLNDAVNASVTGTVLEITTSATANFAVGITGTSTQVGLFYNGYNGAWGASDKPVEHTASGTYTFVGGAPTNQIIRIGQSGWAASEADGTIRANRAYLTRVNTSVSAAAAYANEFINTADGLTAKFENNSASVANSRAVATFNRAGGPGFIFQFQNNGNVAGGIAFGAGSPEGVITATPGTLYTNTSGGAGTTLYVKESGTGNTGWVAK